MRRPATACVFAAADGGEPLSSRPVPAAQRIRRTAGRIGNRTLLTTYRAVLEFVDDRGHRDAAQIAFFAILSFIPMALLLIGAFGTVFEDAEVRERVITAVFDNVPLAQEGDRPKLERTVADSLDGAGSLGPFSIVLLLVAATGVMGAMRHSINQAWDIEARPPLLRRKALDLALVLGATLILVFSLSLSATQKASNLVDDEDGGGSLVALLLDGLGDVLPFLFTTGVILFLYRVLPMQRPTVREIWPGALVAAIGLTLVKGGLEIYFEHLSNFGALYGSLGAAMALLLFAYASAIVLVFGAEFASEWARLPPDAVVRRTVRTARHRVLARLPGR